MVSLETNGAGPITYDTVESFPALSVMVTEYVPGVNAVMEEEVCPSGSHWYVYGRLPPETETEAVPFELSGQVALEVEGVMVNCEKPE